MSISHVDTQTAADMGWCVVHATTPGGPVTIATRLLGDRTTAEQAAALMQANSDGIGHYIVVHAIAETDVWECPDYYAALAALRDTRPPSLHPGADDTLAGWDPAPLRELRAIADGPRYTPEDMGVFASFLPADDGTGPDGGAAA